MQMFRKPATSLPVPKTGPASTGTTKIGTRRPSALIIVENMAVPSDRRVWQEATSLAKSGWEVRVICPRSAKHPVSRERLEGVEIYRHSLPFEANGLAGYVLEYGWALTMEALTLLRIGPWTPDVVQICNPPDFLFLPAWIARLFGAKVIFDHHDLTPELLAEKKGGQSSAMMGFAKWAERRTFALADRVISTNAAFAEIAEKRGNKRAEDISVVYSAPDLQRLPRVPANPSLKNGKSNLLFWIGMIGSQDGVDLLLEAIPILKEKLGHDDFHLLIGGDGPERPALMQQARDMNIEDLVSFPGFLSGSELHEAFSTADIGVGSDPKNDFNDRLAMNKVMEYMAYSLPIAMFDLTECMRIAGEAAICAGNNSPGELADAIALLIRDPQRRAEMGEAGHRRLKAHYSWAQQEQTYLAVWNGLLAGRT